MEMNGSVKTGSTRAVKIRKHVALLALALTLLAAGAGATAQTASAYPNGNVWLIIKNSNCFAGGKVTGVFGAVSASWSGGDWGDNIIYPYVVFNQTDVFNGRAWCSNSYVPGGGYWINIVWFQFRPTGWNQNFWY